VHHAWDTVSTLQTSVTMPGILFGDSGDVEVELTAAGAWSVVRPIAPRGIRRHHGSAHRGQEKGAPCQPDQMWNLSDYGRRGARAPDG
jgi:hypothetical protein